MKYQKEISKTFIKVWEDFYISYATMFKILEPVYKKYQEYKKNRMEKEIQSMNFSSNVDSSSLLGEQPMDNKLNLKESNKIRERFRAQFDLELQKVDFFYNENITRVIRPKIKEIKEQIKHAIKVNEFKMNNETFEMAIKETYKDIYLTRKFVETNFEIKDKLMSKYKKYFGMESQNSTRKNDSSQNNEIIMEDEKENDDENNNDEIESNINNFISFKSAIGQANETLKNLEDEITQIFIQNFTYKYKSKTDKILKKYIQTNNFTESQSFYLGFFIGLLLFQLGIICTIAYYYDIDMDHDVEFKSVFPMFRGFFIVCLYWWMHGLNILVWTKADISYRVIFQIDSSQYSTPIEIFKRAAIFTFILLSCLLIYMIKRIWAGAFFGIFDPIPINCLPLICWGSIIAYSFCPFEIWNYDGRLYLGQLAKESFGSFLLKTGFKHVFFMGQMCSFIAPMRDIEYTLCYYAYYDAPLWAKIEYCKKTRGVYFFIAFFPNFLRILQNIKEIYDSKKLFPKFYSIFNYCLSISVALLSFLWPKHPSLHIYWLIFTFISSCCSFAWDIIIDFGFFEEGENYPLRNKLYYKPKLIYYLIALYNFVLRFFWLLTISPEVLGTLFRPETLSIILNSFEITRRACWNILKVENKHIDISKEFKVSNEIELPFVKVNGKYVNNESNLLNIMKMSRQEKIQVEIEKVLQENRSNSRAKYMSRNLTDLKEVKGKMNNDLNEYLEVYKRDTGVNLGTISTKLNQPTRRWATNY